MKNKLKKLLQEVVADIVGEDIVVTVDVPENMQYGDYTSNIALVLSKKLGKPPRETAEVIVSKLQSEQSSFIKKIDIAGPGFINIFISKDGLKETIDNILSQKEKYARGDSLKNKKMMFEFGDPNPFKEFHIGHLYTCTIGETLSRLAESQDAEVRRVCYQGDVGLHVAKAIYGMMKKLNDMPSSKAPLSERAKFLGESYAYGATMYEEDNEAKEEMNVLNKVIYERSDAMINQLYDMGKAWSLEYFDRIYERLGTSFTRFYFESEVGKTGLELVKEYIGKVFEEDQGAVIFPGKKYGLHNRVFINSLGLPTYEAKELGLAPAKYEEFAYDESVIITGNEINEYFKVLIKALSLINADLSSKTRHISHGMVRLPEGKMSSRTGNVITGEWLLDTAKEKIQEHYSTMKEETAEQVAVAAVKYALLKSGIGQDIKFSFEESISFEGNSGPYLQYTHARTNSLLEKGKFTKEMIVFSENLEKEEDELVRTLLHFTEVVEEAAEKYSPHVVCTYLFDLAQKFNLFYQKHHVIEGGDKKEFRLTLTAATGQVIKNGLYLLGIQAPGKM